MSSQLQPEAALTRARALRAALVSIARGDQSKQSRKTPLKGPARNNGTTARAISGPRVWIWTWRSSGSGSECSSPLQSEVRAVGLSPFLRTSLTLGSDVVSAIDPVAATRGETTTGHRERGWCRWRAIGHARGGMAQGTRRTPSLGRAPVAWSGGAAGGRRACRRRRLEGPFLSGFLAPS